MALVALGVTQCGLCNRALTDQDDILGFPDYVGWDYFWLADGAVHRDCFSLWPKRIDFIQSFNATNPRLVLDDQGKYCQRGNAA